MRKRSNRSVLLPKPRPRPPPKPPPPKMRPRVPRPPPKAKLPQRNRFRRSCSATDNDTKRQRFAGNRRLFFHPCGQPKKRRYEEINLTFPRPYTIFDPGFAGTAGHAGAGRSSGTARLFRTAAAGGGGKHPSRRCPGDSRLGGRRNPRPGRNDRRFRTRMLNYRHLRTSA